MTSDSHLGASQQPQSTPAALLMAQPTASSVMPGEKNVPSLSTRPHPLGFAGRRPQQMAGRGAESWQPKPAAAEASGTAHPVLPRAPSPSRQQGTLSPLEAAGLDPLGSGSWRESREGRDQVHFSLEKPPWMVFPQGRPDSKDGSSPQGASWACSDPQGCLWLGEALRTVPPKGDLLLALWVATPSLWVLQSCCGIDSFHVPRGQPGSSLPEDITCLLIRVFPRSRQ